MAPAQTKTSARGENHTAFVEALKNAEPWAWNAFYREFGPLIQRLVAGFGKAARGLEEDMCQEIMAQVYRKIGTHRGQNRARLQSWVTRIARNKLLDHCKLASTKNEGKTSSLDQQIPTEEGEASLAELIPGNSPSPDRQIMHQQLLERLSAWLLPQLKDSHIQKIWLLMAEEGITSPKEIAEQLQIPENRVSKEKARLLGLARKWLDLLGGMDLAF